MIHPSFYEARELRPVKTRTVPKDEFRTAYYNWLAEKAGFPYMKDTYGASYDTLREVLVETPFTWVHPMDENRAYDAMDYRWICRTLTGFTYEGQPEIDDDIEGWPPSVLEVLMGVAANARYMSMTDSDEEFWFWIFLENLGLDRAYDGSGLNATVIRNVLRKWMERRYSADGTGSIFKFPPKRAPKGFKDKEIWYQLNDYFMANGY